MTIANFQKEVGYLKQELIEARAHKSASDDQLGNVSGKLETLENTITSLSDEGSHFNDITIIQHLSARELHYIFLWVHLCCFFDVSKKIIE